MKIICKKDVLINNINIVSKAVSNKSTKQILECILLNADSESLVMSAFDMELGIVSSPIEAEVEVQGSVALNAKLFTEIVKHLPDGDVTITVNEKFLTKIICGNADFKINGLNGEEFPAMPEVEKQDCICINQKEFRDMIRQTIFAVSVEENRITFTGGLLEIKDDCAMLTTVDGFRIANRKTVIEKSENENEIIIPSKTLNELLKLLIDSNDVYIYFTNKHVLFDLGFATVISRLIEGEFFKYEHLFGNEYSTLLTVNRQYLCACIERVILVSPASKRIPITIKIFSDYITVFSEADLGSAHDEMQAKIEGANIEISFNPKYVIDVLKAIDEEEITIQFTTPLSPCIVRAVGNNNVQYMVLPMKLPTR